MPTGSSGESLLLSPFSAPLPSFGINPWIWNECTGSTPPSGPPRPTVLIRRRGGEMPWVGHDYKLFRNIHFFIPISDCFRYFAQVVSISGVTTHRCFRTDTRHSPFGLYSFISKPTNVLRSSVSLQKCLSFECIGQSSSQIACVFERFAISPRPQKRCSSSNSSICIKLIL